DAGPDFQRASDLSEQHTGVEATGPGEGDDVCAQKVGELLDGELTVDKAVRVALLSNREFLALFYEIGVSRADLVQSGLLTNPSFSLLYKLPEGGGLPDVEASIAQEIAD